MDYENLDCEFFFSLKLVVRYFCVKLLPVNTADCTIDVCIIDAVYIQLTLDDMFDYFDREIKGFSLNDWIGIRKGSVNCSRSRKRLVN